jgi:hypothetical protein
MLDKRQINFTREQRKWDRADLGEGPTLPAAAGRERLIPHSRDFVTQAVIADLHEIGEKFSDLCG